MLGEQSHSGSHSAYYGSWRFSGGGSLVGKGCHPLSTVLYLKRVEGQTRDGVAIRPATVSARTHEITQLPAYRDAGFLRTAYEDVEDYAQIHVKFSDGTVADIFSSELVVGGVHNWLEVYVQPPHPLHLNPIDALESSTDDQLGGEDVCDSPIGEFDMDLGVVFNIFVRRPQEPRIAISGQLSDFVGSRTYRGGANCNPIACLAFHSL